MEKESLIILKIESNNIKIKEIEKSVNCLKEGISRLFLLNKPEKQTQETR
jgi:hypothetical protein